MAKKKTKSRPTIKYFYEKTSNYRTYHVDGIFGGITSQGKIYMDIFIERNPGPDMIEHKITKEGRPGEEIRRSGDKPGIIRQIECGLVVDLSTAATIRDWIDNKIQMVKSIPEEK